MVLRRQKYGKTLKCTRNDHLPLLKAKQSRANRPASSRATVLAGKSFLRLAAITAARRPSSGVSALSNPPYNNRVTRRTWKPTLRRHKVNPVLVIPRNATEHFHNMITDNDFFRALKTTARVDRVSETDSRDRPSRRRLRFTTNGRAGEAVSRARPRYNVKTWPAPPFARKYNLSAGVSQDSSAKPLCGSFTRFGHGAADCANERMRLTSIHRRRHRCRLHHRRATTRRDLSPRFLLLLLLFLRLLLRRVITTFFFFCSFFSSDKRSAVLERLLLRRRRRRLPVLPVLPLPPRAPAEERPPDRPTARPSPEKDTASGDDDDDSSPNN